MGLGVRIDWATDLRHPQPNSEVLEQWEDQPELIVIENPLRLTHHHSLKTRAGSSNAASKPADSGRRTHDTDLDCPTSKNSVTIRPQPATNASARDNCH
jgi:hypothetical protein